MKSSQGFRFSPVPLWETEARSSLSSLCALGVWNRPLSQRGQGWTLKPPVRLSEPRKGYKTRAGTAQTVEALRELLRPLLEGWQKGLKNNPTG